MQLLPTLSAIDAFREKQRRNGKCRKDAFSESDERFLVAYYPNAPTREIARILNRSKKSIIVKAYKMGLRKDPEVISKTASENNRGEKHHQYGKPLSIETRLKISKAEKGKKRGPKFGRKVSIALKGRILSLEHRKKISAARKGKSSWNKGKRLTETHIRNWLRANQIRPNKPERKLDALIQGLIPSEFKMNLCDGSIIIDGKIPDWVNCNGKKKLIELFGDYWHDKNDEEKRMALFAKYGFETLVIWEHELAEPELVKEKLLNFVSEE